MLKPLLVLALVPLPLFAQGRVESHCIALSQGPETVWRAGWQDPVDAGSVRLTYIDHSMVMVQTEGGLTAVTDYAGYIGDVGLVPDVVTMNHAHSTHYTLMPDSRIPHVLEGWGAFGEGIEHRLELGEMLVRNVSTDIRLGEDGVEPSGNSIFIFEVAGLCIGHLGHLHHEPNDEDYALIGRLDVVIAPVDGGRTLDLPTMIKVVKRLRSSVVIPVHWFNGGSLTRFIAGMEGEFEIEMTESSETLVSLKTLPPRPVIRVLMPQFLE
jgi:L-ascorbate metabolism protein UlaG (beta-lactamase superfamily)